MYYKDVLWAKNKMESWGVKAIEDVKSGNLVCPDKAAMDRANKVGMKNELPFRGDANIGKCPIVFIQTKNQMTGMMTKFRTTTFSRGGSQSQQKSSQSFDIAAQLYG